MSFDCRGDKNKESIVQDYFLTPLMYTTLLEGREKLGCFGKLEREYYVFRAKHKKENTEFCFFVGKHCAEKFLLLIKHPKLELFNLFTSETNNEGMNNSPNNESNILIRDIDPINKELIDAIYILNASWNRLPALLDNIIEYTHKKESLINVKGVKWLNEKLMYDKQNRTMTEIYLNLKKENKRIRTFSFKKLKAYFSDNFPNEINRF